MWFSELKLRPRVNAILYKSLFKFFLHQNDNGVELYIVAFDNKTLCLRNL